MGNTVYRIDALRDKVVALLRREKGALQRDQIATLLELPTYAADAALESALVGGLVEYSAGSGWWIKAAAPQASGVAQ